MLRASSGALRLYAISTRPASTATVAVFKDSLSFSTELSLHRQRRAQGSEATGREVSHGLTAKTANNRFTVLRPWYGLSTLSTRTLGYALGRSARARRQLHGQANHSTLYELSLGVPTNSAPLRAMVCCSLCVRTAPARGLLPSATAPKSGSRPRTTGPAVPMLADAIGACRTLRPCGQGGRRARAVERERVGVPV